MSAPSETSVAAMKRMGRYLLGHQRLAWTSDLKAETAIVEQRSATYELPPNLKSKFSDEEVAEMRVHFGMFDADGGGSIAAEELAQVSHNPNPKPYAVPFISGNT